MGGLRAIAAVQNSVTLGTRQAAEGIRFQVAIYMETSGDQFRYDELPRAARVFVSNGQSRSKRWTGKSPEYPPYREALFPFQLPACGRELG